MPRSIVMIALVLGISLVSGCDGKKEYLTKDQWKYYISLEDVFRKEAVAWARWLHNNRRLVSEETYQEAEKRYAAVTREQHAVIDKIRPLPASNAEHAWSALASISHSGLERAERELYDLLEPEYRAAAESRDLLADSAEFPSPVSFDDHSKNASVQRPDKVTQATELTPAELKEIRNQLDAEELPAWESYEDGIGH